jgi:beta-lactamase regulating signal transducer with metallopeptidase domain
VTLLNHLWQSTVFAIAVAILTLAFRNNRAQVRYALWLGASLKFLLPFSLLMALGGALHVAPPAAIAAPEVAVVVNVISEPFPMMPIPAAAAPPRASTNWIPAALIAAWILGMLAIAGLRIRAWLRIRAAIRASVRLDIGTSVEVRSAPDVIGHGVIGHGVIEPGVVGWLHPILLLPEGIAERLTPAQFETVLAHELCHVRRRDSLFAAIHMMVECLFWFHPFVWWIGARMVEERERACDENVLALGGEPRVYADAILNVCKLYVESPLACVAGVTGSNLKRRIEAIMRNQSGRALTRPSKLLLAAAGVAAIAGPVAIGVIGVAGTSSLSLALASPHLLDPPPTSPPPLPGPPQHTEPAQSTLPEPSVAATPAVVEQSAADAQSPQTAEGRPLAILFDLDSMSADDQARARNASWQFVQSRARPEDSIAILNVENGAVKVLADFTTDRAALESAIEKSAGPTANSPGDASRLATLETVAKMLGALSGRKSLIYLSSGTKWESENIGALRATTNAFIRANVAVYSIDARGISPLVPLMNGRMRSTGAAAAPAWDAASTQIGLRYLERYGKPDETEERGAGTSTPSQIWRYRYLEKYRSNVEFEFTRRTGSASVKINWPPATAKFVGSSGVDMELAGRMTRGSWGGPSTLPASVGGLPGGHASMETYPAGEPQVLTVPEFSSTGVTIAAEVNPVDANGGMRAAPNVFTVATFTLAPFRTDFKLDAGAYVCTLIVYDRGTQAVYGETIHFEVK